MTKQEVYEAKKYFRIFDKAESLAFSFQNLEADIHRFFAVCAAIQGKNQERLLLREFGEVSHLWMIQSSTLHWMGFVHYRNLTAGLIQKCGAYLGISLELPYPLRVGRIEADIAMTYEELTKGLKICEAAAMALLLLEDILARLKALPEEEQKLMQDELFLELYPEYRGKCLQDLLLFCSEEEREQAEEVSIQGIAENVLRLQGDLENALQVEQMI